MMIEKTMDVVALGALAVDYYAVVPKLPLEEEKTTASDYIIRSGGVAGNVLTQTARLGLKSGWIGKLGSDASGEILMKEFEKDGVDLSHTEVVKDKNSMFTWITVNPQGGRSIVMFPNVLAEFTAEDVVAKHADYIASSRILQAEACLLPLNIMLAGLRIAKRNGVMTVFDLDVAPSEIERSKMGTKEELAEIISLTDVLIPCKTAATELLGSIDYAKEAKRLLSMGPSTIAITLGAKGCLVLNSREQYLIDQVYVPSVVDTTGAGDAFHGGMIYALLEGMSLKDAGRFANACGAFCCTQIGARSMGTIQELRLLLEG
jgi:sugar/nucleoside kinase (ribokinase family)